MSRKRAIDKLLREVPLFATLTANERLLVTQRATYRHFREQESIFRRGDLRGELLVVISGRIRLFQSFNGELEILALLEAGSFIGEQALINPTTRHEQSAVADSATDVFGLKGSDFLTLRRRHPHLAVKILSNVLCALADRLSHADTKLLTLYATGKIAALPANLNEQTSQILRTVAAAVHARQALFVVFQSADDAFVIREAIGYRKNLRGKRCHLAADPLFGRLHRLGEDLLVTREQYARDPHWKTAYSAPGMLLMPVTAGRRMIAAILVGDKRAGEDFSVNNRLLVSIVARQIASAVGEAAIEEERKLTEELERVYIKPL